MKKYFPAIVALLLSFGHGYAQYLRLPEGKKFRITIETNNNTDITMMDQHMQMLSDISMYSEVEIKTVTKNGYSLELIPKHMRMAMSVMGREQKIDTDSVTDHSDPLTAKSLEIINKPQSVVVEDGKITFRTKLADVNTVNNNVDDINKFFLTIKTDNYKQGYQWADSTIEGGVKLINSYTIMNVTDTEVEVNANLDMQIQSIGTQAEVEIKQNIKGFGTGKRRYNKSTGLLISEISEIDMNGTSETNDLSVPIIIKLKTKTAVQ